MVAHRHKKNNSGSGKAAEGKGEIGKTSMRVFTPSPVVRALTEKVISKKTLGIRSTKVCVDMYTQLMKAIPKLDTRNDHTRSGIGKGKGKGGAQESGITKTEGGTYIGLTEDLELRSMFLAVLHESKILVKSMVLRKTIEKKKTGKKEYVLMVTLKKWLQEAYSLGVTPGGEKGGRGSLFYAKRTAIEYVSRSHF